MCTYGRFECVERAMNCFLAQTYPNKELIIYNTDVEHPYTKILPINHEIYDPYEAAILKDINIIIVNQNIDSVTKEQYTNVGAIRRDALTHANGDFVVTWDDDDIFLPHPGLQKVYAVPRPFHCKSERFLYLINLFGNLGGFSTVLELLENG